MLLLVMIIKAICEIALLSLAGRGLLVLLAGKQKESNLFYQLLVVLTRPFVGAARYITPKIILDRHVPLVAFSLLVIVWIVALIEKVKICTQIGIELCK
ncbi:MAG: hypothetical protein HC858_08195 [Brachymonas sp.]|nr:hypothetical protein [Brachymonas sp.]NJS36090.1 hypothetical protein [Brachymonas sp.]